MFRMSLRSVVASIDVLPHELNIDHCIHIQRKPKEYSDSKQRTSVAKKMAASIQYVSKSTSTSMMCSNCKKLVNVHDLVRVYGSSCDDIKDSSSRKVCGSCLAGYHVPVLRPSSRRWEFGTILSYNGPPSRIDQQWHQHEIKFADGSKEWVSVMADPFEAYAQHFDDVLEAERGYKRKVSENHSCGRQNRDPANVMIHPTQLENIYRQDSYPIEYGEAQILYHDLQSSSFDSSEDYLFYPPHPALENAPRTEEVSFVDRPAKKKARFNISFNHVCDSPVNRKDSVMKSTTLDSPVDSHISSLSADSPHSSSSSASRIFSGTSSTTSSQRSARLWTPTEDKLLLDTIAENNNQLCWPKIALSVPGRTGKQCRERYLNHLGPHLKQSGWSALEDATIFHLYAIYGSKWSKIVKIGLPGRTDNGIKNRFHHLRRRFEKRMRSIPNSKELTMMINKMGNSPSFRNLLPDWFVTRDIAIRILKDSANANQDQLLLSGDGEYKFGPFDQFKQSAGCARCGLIVPSKETGISICRQTGWCETCTGISLAISGDLLRAIHWVREDEEIILRDNLKIEGV